VSRTGLKNIEVPENVEVSYENNVVIVKGPKGEVSRNISPLIKMNIDDDVLSFEKVEDTKEAQGVYGTTRTNVANMIEGVTDGYEKRLELVGVGYRAQMQGNKLTVNVGLSHPVEFEAGDDIEIETPAQDQIVVKGIDKEKVGQLAANIRDVRPPEPYKGKGIRYQNEYILRKEGKTGK
jgi:large subunit ribosomal protein L6